MECEELTCGRLIKENYDMIMGIKEIVKENKRNIFGSENVIESAEKEKSSRDSMIGILQDQNKALKIILEELGSCTRTLML